MSVNYNDGNWHDWNGGECPVHPNSEIEGYWRNDNISGLHVVHNRGLGHHMNFKHDGGAQLQVFRVVKEYREPREWWLVVPADNKSYCATAFASHRAAENTRQYGERLVHVREVAE